MNDNLFLHPPAESTTRYVQWYEKLLNTPGIDYGCVMDKRVIPLHRGDVMAVLARPGHGKSSFMAYMAKREANKIIDRKTEKDECVIYVSWEQPIEELEAFFQSGANYNSTDLAWGRVRYPFSCNSSKMRSILSLPAEPLLIKS